jgi:hypothetical protein
MAMRLVEALEDERAQCGSAGHVGFAVDVAEAVVDGVFADVESCRDRSPRQTLQDALGDLALAIRQSQGPEGHGGAPFAVMEYEVPPQFAPPPVLHRHTREFGAVYVLDGELVYWFEDGQARAARPGTLVVMGKDWFRWANEQSTPARILCIFAPAGFE